MGGGGGGDPGAEARRQEQERQARIQAATEQINRIFNNQVQRNDTRYVFDDSRARLLDAMTDDQGRASIDLMGMSRAVNPKVDFANRYLDSLPIQRDSSGRRILTAEQFNQIRGQQGFDPSLWREETTTTWVDGDPSNSRDRLYQQQRQAVFDINRMDVDRQAAEAERTNRFALARTGLLGGSAAIDSNAEINRRTNEGLMRAGGIADASAAELKAQDERTRANLISMAQSGIDTGSAATMAAQGLQANAEQAASARGGATIGSLFQDLSQAYLMNQVNQGRSGVPMPQQQQWFGVSSPSQSYDGRVTR